MTDISVKFLFSQPAIDKSLMQKGFVGAMGKGKYYYLKNRYPEQISLDQFYKICQISKRSASYLLTNGIVPAVDTGKKTWRYRIAIADVITYLHKREQWGSMIPVGAASSKRNRLKNARTSFSKHIEEGAEAELGEYFEYIYADYPDVLMAADVSEMTGLVKDTIIRYLRAGKIKSIRTAGNKYAIPKANVMEFAVSREFIDCKSNSKSFIKLVQGFELWRRNVKGGKP